MQIHINEVDRLEVLTLQDNYVDVMALDETDDAWAGRTTRVDKVHAVMRGFHLTGKNFIPAIEPMERAVPDRFILNMSGPTLTFFGA